MLPLFLDELLVLKWLGLGGQGRMGLKVRRGKVAFGGHYTSES